MSFYCQVKMGRVLSTDIVGTTIDVDFSFGGETPKAFIIWGVGRGEAVGTDGAGTSGLSLSRGYGISPSLRYAAVWQDMATTNPTRVASSLRADGCLCHETADVIAGRLDVNTMSANKVQLVVDQQFDIDYTFVVQAWAGTAITNATAFDSTLNTSLGSTPVTNPGFQVKFFDCMSIGITGGIPQTTSGAARVSIGCGLPSTAENLVVSTVAVDNVATTDTASYSLESECLAVMTATNTTQNRVACDGTNALGWSWNILKGTGAVRYCALALGGTFGVAYDAFLSQFPAEPGDAHLTPAGFNTIAGGLMFSACRGVSTVDTPTATAEMSLGGFNGPQNAGAVLAQGFIDPDNVAAAGATPATAVRNTDVYVNLTSAGVVEGAMTMPTEADNPGDLRFTESTTDAQQNLIQVIVFGEMDMAMAVSGHGYRHRRHRQKSYVQRSRFW